MADEATPLDIGKAAHIVARQKCMDWSSVDADVHWTGSVSVPFKIKTGFLNVC